MECRRSVGERLEGTHEQIRQVHVLPAAGGLQQDSSLAATNAICRDTLCRVLKSNSWQPELAMPMPMWKQRMCSCSSTRIWSLSILVIDHDNLYRSDIRVRQQGFVPVPVGEQAQRAPKVYYDRTNVARAMGLPPFDARRRRQKSAAPAAADQVAAGGQAAADVDADTTHAPDAAPPQHAPLPPAGKYAVSSDSFGQHC